MRIAGVQVEEFAHAHIPLHADILLDEINAMQVDEDRTYPYLTSLALWRHL